MVGELSFEDEKRNVEEENGGILISDASLARYANLYLIEKHVPKSPACLFSFLRLSLREM